MAEPPLDPRALAEELRVLRRAGLLRLRDHELPALTGAADAAGLPIDDLLDRVVAGLDGNLAQATAYTFGLAAGTRDWPAQERRKQAAKLYGVSPDAFRKSQEELILKNLAHEIIKLVDGYGYTGTGLPLGTTRRIPVGGTAVTLHRRPVETLRGVEVIVSSENTYLEMSKTYKSSLSATLRNAAAVRNEAGDVVDDVLPRQLRAWMRAHGREGGTVIAGTVVPTSPGELAGNGVRRVYHAATVVPRPGADRYDVQPVAVVRAVRNVFGLAAHEGMRSICFPLFGAGRGGLEAGTAFDYLWSALAPYLGEPFDIHVITRSDQGTRAALTGLQSAH
ncbi:macro domain-containing protein [Spongiactinospora sp. TRM90649]|uniref:macro domain-containing protein n=1 Tax=Spongiactinospora sp. TRM90649 TaxID=3031114 RepID=UPI0023F79AF9|nr:macro domain-containing protein [Spongiactinospora sp. TRM90649]MDF5757506.1 hypothetical protein [Spongiactinospora sp. TRM90649]